MIQIKIEPLRFNKIKKEYLKKLNSLLIDGRIKDKNKEKAIKKVHNEINEELKKLGIKYTIEEIIIADFNIIREIKDKLDQINTDKFNKIICVYEVYEDKNGNIPKEKWVKGSKFQKIYDTYNKIDNVWLIEELKITVCPYCNRNYINNMGRSTAAQLDHFYPRSKYPIFALSLSNLIPSCYACNHKKRENEINVSPYDEEFKFDESITFSYSPISYNYLNDSTQLKIDMEYNNQISSNINEMKIKEAYKLHTDYVQELIKKAEVYNDFKIYELLNNYNGLFSSKEEIIRSVFGNYIDEKELGKRPLAKLTKDILKELGIYT